MKSKDAEKTLTKLESLITEASLYFPDQGSRDGFLECADSTIYKLTSRIETMKFYEHKIKWG